MIHLKEFEKNHQTQNDDKNHQNDENHHFEIDDFPNFQAQSWKAQRFPLASAQFADSTAETCACGSAAQSLS